MSRGDVFAAHDAIRYFHFLRAVNNAFRGSVFIGTVIVCHTMLQRAARVGISLVRTTRRLRVWWTLLIVPWKLAACIIAAAG